MQVVDGHKRQLFIITVNFKRDLEEADNLETLWVRDRMFKYCMFCGFHVQSVCIFVQCVCMVCYACTWCLSVCNVNG